MLDLKQTDQQQQPTIHEQLNELDPAYAQFRDQSRFWIQRVAVPLIMVVGLFGNLITVIIMTRRRMRSTTNMYLAALAFVDMLYLVLTFLLGLSHYPNMAGYKYYAYWKVRPFLMMLTDACSNTSVWLTVTFTIERYIAVKYPMKGKVWCTEARAKMLIICVFVFGVLFAMPVPFEWKVIEKRVGSPVSTLNTNANAAQIMNSNQRQRTTTQANETKITSAVPENDLISSYQPTDKTSDSIVNISDGIPTSLLECRDDTTEVTINDSCILALDYSDFGRNETYKTIYYWSTAVIFYFIPLFSLMLFNGFLIKSVHQSQRERKRMIGINSSRHQQQKQTLTQKPQTLNVSPRQYSDKDTSDLTINGCKDILLATCHNHDEIHDESLQGSSQKINGRSPQRITADDAGSSTRNNDDEQINNSNSCLKEDSPLISERLKKQPCLDATIQTEISETKALTSCDSESVNERVEGDKLSSRIVKTTESRQSSIQHHQANNNSNKKTQLGPLRTLEGLSARYMIPRICPSTNTSLSSQQTIVPVSSQERRITIMLIAVVILFLVCQIPTAALLLYTSVHEMIPNTNEHALVLAFGNIFNFLMAVNAAGNFILYSFLSKKYRRTFMILFCNCFGTTEKFDRSNKMLSVRFEQHKSCQMSRISSSNKIYQNNRSSDSIPKDTLV